MRHGLSAILVAAMASPAAAQDMIGIGASQLYRIDSATGQARWLNSLGYPRLDSLARDSSGRFYTAGDRLLHEVHLASSTVGRVAIMTLSQIRGMAFAPDDTLYAVEGGDLLYTIDPQTGASALVGPIGFPNVQALEWFQGTLYGWDCGDGTGSGAGLITIDPATGAGTDVDPSVPGTCGQIQSLADAGDGRLYGANVYLSIVDPATGGITLVGSTAIIAGIGGLAFTPTCEFGLFAPAPGTVGTNAVRYSCATPRGYVALFAGLNRGPGPGLVCDTLSLGIADSHLLGIQLADATGRGEFSITAPPALSRSQILLQLADAGGCRVSNLVQHWFP